MGLFTFVVTRDPERVFSIFAERKKFVLIPKLDVSRRNSAKPLSLCISPWDSIEPANRLPALS